MINNFYALYSICSISCATAKRCYALTNIASVGKCHLIYHFALNVIRMFIKAHTQAALKEHS